MDTVRYVLFPIVILLTVVSCSNRSVARMVADEEWTSIVEHYSNSDDEMRIIDVCWQNIALAETGQLADSAFYFKQAGSSGLIPDWDWDTVTGNLLSRLAYSMGHIAMAQKMAFEANVSSDSSYDPEAVRMLVRTNLIYGAWEVAGKYISLLEKDRNYSDWASRQRTFLHNDEAIDNDPEYGLKRKCVPCDDFVSGSTIDTDDLKKIIRANPAHRNTIQYLGLVYLTDCDFESFRGLLDEFYGTDALPELPESFAEAACMMSELEPGYWKTVGVETEIFRSFCDFKKRLDAGLSLERFAGTYWCYVKDFFEK